MNKSSDHSVNQYLILFYALIVLLIVSFSCVWQCDNSVTEGEERCIGSLIQRLRRLKYLWESFPSFVGCIWSAVAFGLAVTIFTWAVVKNDSSIPGICPPSPLSPKNLRFASGHDFHLCYVLAIVNGVTLGILSMGVDSG